MRASSSASRAELELERDRSASMREGAEGPEGVVKKKMRASSSASRAQLELERDRSASMREELKAQSILPIACTDCFARASHRYEH